MQRAAKYLVWTSSIISNRTKIFCHAWRGIDGLEIYFCWCTVLWPILYLLYTADIFTEKYYLNNCAKLCCLFDHLWHAIWIPMKVNVYRSYSFYRSRNLQLSSGIWFKINCNNEYYSKIFYNDYFFVSLFYFQRCSGRWWW